MSQWCQWFLHWWNDLAIAMASLKPEESSGTCFDRRWCRDWFVFIRVLAQRTVSYRAITCRCLSNRSGVTRVSHDQMLSHPVPWSLPSSVPNVPSLGNLQLWRCLVDDVKYCRVTGFGCECFQNLPKNQRIQRALHKEVAEMNGQHCYFGLLTPTNLDFLDPKWGARNFEGPAGLMHFKAAQGSRLK
jgi:hypothetical protein